VQLELLDCANCQVFLTSSPMLPVVKSILSKTSMPSHSLPGLHHWLQDIEVPKYPYQKTFDTAKHEPFVALHTSGSTGSPKVVELNHGTMAPLDAYQLIPAMGGKPTISAYWKEVRLFLSAPLFLSGPICVLLGMNVFCDLSIILPPPVPITAEFADIVHTCCDVNASFWSPSILIDISKSQRYLNNLQRLRYIIYGGGNLPTEVGEVISEKTRITMMFGATETCVLPMELMEPEEWEYVKFSPWLGHQYRHYMDDLYELVIARDESLCTMQGVFSTFPKLKEYLMKDLYSMHPIKADLWRFRGRTDDLILLSTGSRFCPLAAEGIISAHPAVNASLVCGQGRSQSSLLIEPNVFPASDKDKAEMKQRLWPLIQRANHECPSFGKVIFELILFTSARKPMSRAGKGTIRRIKTYDLYRGELDEAYQRASTGKKMIRHTPHDLDQRDLVGLLRSWLPTTAGIESVDKFLDVFELGLDSTQIVTFVAKINSWLTQTKGSSMWVNCKIVYANPTVPGLARALTKHAGLPENPTAIKSLIITDHRHTMQSIYESLALNLPTVDNKVNIDARPGSVILLTGSTGSLGSYLLESLLQDPTVLKVYCLNRGDATEARQTRSHLEKGLKTNLSDERAVFLKCDLLQPYLGLLTSDYTALLHDVTHVVHNAWDVDFNRPVDSFVRTSLRGVRHLINFFAQSAHGALLFFVSTTETIPTRAVTSGEKIFRDWTDVPDLGYVQAKAVAEKLLTAATENLRLPSALCRVSQVTGPTSRHGMWNRREWFPSMVASSEYLGKIPSFLGRMDAIDWIPVDTAAQVIAELVNGSVKEFAMQNPGIDQCRHQPANSSLEGQVAPSQEPALPLVYHVANSIPTNWQTLLPVVKQCLSQSKGSEVEVVALSQWLGALRESSTCTTDIAKNPALKLLPFFEGLDGHSACSLPVETGLTRTKSPTLRMLQAVSCDLMTNWMRQWAY